MDGCEGLVKQTGDVAPAFLVELEARAPDLGVGMIESAPDAGLGRVGNDVAQRPREC